MYKQRDVVLIPITFTALTSIKKRPVVVISNDEFNKNKEDIIVSAITSNVLWNKYAIPITEKDMEGSTLPRPSMVRVDKIYTLNQAIVLKKFDIVRKETFEKIRSKIQVLFSTSL
jgi:mRNA interferase MazF